MEYFIVGNADGSYVDNRGRSTKTPKELNVYLSEYQAQVDAARANTYVQGMGAALRYAPRKVDLYTALSHAASDIEVNDADEEYAVFENPSLLVRILGNLELMEAGISDVSLAQRLCKLREYDIRLLEYRFKAGDAWRYQAGANIPIDGPYTPHDIVERHGRTSAFYQTPDDLEELDKRYLELEASYTESEGDEGLREELDTLREQIDALKDIPLDHAAVWWPGAVDAEIYPPKFLSYSHDVYSFELRVAIRIDELKPEQEDQE